MNRAGWTRRLALLAMAVVTAWSLWAWGQAAKSPIEKKSSPMAKSVPREPAMREPAPVGEKPAPANEVQGQGIEAHPESEQPARINWTEFGKETPPFIAMIINFGILVAGYYLLGKKPIMAGLKNRRDTIAKDIEEAQAMKREAEQRAKIYQAKLERVEQEVQLAREALVRAGEAERDRIVADAEANAERMRKDAQFLVEQELKQMRQDVWRDTVEAAVAAAEELLKKRVTSADQERLAEEFLADLGGRTKPSAAQEALRPTTGPEPGTAS